jgi:hypothetical protein
MGNKLKFAGFLGRVFLVNTAAGVGAMTGVGLTAVAMTKVAKKITGKSLLETLFGAIEEQEKKAEENK